MSRIRRELTGWGRTAPSGAEVVAPLGSGDVGRFVASANGRGVLARGLGRSYGDAAQNAGGTVLDMTALAGVHDFDPTTGQVRLDAGVSLDALMRWAVPRGWFPLVTPGTRFVTVGGAVAANVHGKNHHVDGTFVRGVSRLTLVTPTGTHEVAPDRDPDLFWATAGGMGLTGVVAEVSMGLRPIATSRMYVDTERARDLDDLLDRMTARDHAYHYSVAWIDCMARGARLGRAVLTRGRHAEVDELPALGKRTPLAYGPRQLAAAPPWVPSGLLNAVTVRAFNEAWFRRAPVHREGEIQTIPAFFHPLDGVAGWNRLYGARGFLQYQMVVPFGAEETLRAVVERLAETRVASFLAVLKRFGDRDPGHLSFPTAGWTLALDLPVGDPRLGPLLDRFDEQVVGAGGRVYLAKDARLRRELVEAMYPRLADWRAVRDRVDPDRRLTSDLDRRLDLTGRYHA